MSLTIREHQEPSVGFSKDSDQIVAKFQDVSRNVERQLEFLLDSIDSHRRSIYSWLKKLPEVSAISFEDQLKLFQTSFFEILVLELVWRSIENHSSNVCVI